ncbi:MAG TPA: STAS domain-containing protein [Methylomirabilota bacterium]|nr:STAS domain-containing protein [Methylomirabilota bacterium]
MDQGIANEARLIGEVIDRNKPRLIDEWVAELTAYIRPQRGLSDNDLREQCAEFLQLLREAMGRGDLRNPSGAGWESVEDFVANLSRTRSQQGFSPTETAVFVFGLKKPLFRMLMEHGNTSPNLNHQIVLTSEFLDKLGLMTTECYQKAREEVISRQQQEMLELSTPVVKLWHGILALPLIGTLDSERTQIVMEQLLQRIVETGSDVAIIDITGVPTVDTLVAQHLLKTVTAARLMGADCIISGIRPQIAQTIVHLGVALGDVTTKSSLADAFAIALARRNYVISKRNATAQPAPNGASQH